MESSEHRRAYQAAWYRANVEKAKEYQRIYNRRKRAERQAKGWQNNISGRGHQFGVEPCRGDEWFVCHPRTIIFAPLAMQRLTVNRFVIEANKFLRAL